MRAVDNVFERRGQPRLRWTATPRWRAAAAKSPPALQVRAEQHVPRCGHEPQAVAHHTPDILARHQGPCLQVLLKASIERTTGQPAAEFSGPANMCCA